MTQRREWCEWLPVKLDGASPADLQAEIDGLRSCCLSCEPFTVRDVMHYRRASGDLAESETVAVFRDTDGRVLVFRQDEDTTGHGCQCHAQVEWFSSLADAYALGLTEDERAMFGVA